MPIISKIFMNVRLELREDFLEGELEADRSAALKQFQQLKKEIALYLETKKVITDISSVHSTSFHSNELDHNFMVNYEEWYHALTGCIAKYSAPETS